MPPWIDPLFHPSMWDWGDAATWVTGIVTAVPIFLALGGLARERKLGRERQAKSIVVYDESGFDAETGNELYTVRVWNYSERPIFYVGLLWFFASWQPSVIGPGELLEGSSQDEKRALLPNDSATFGQLIPKGESFEFAGIVFHDIDGQVWIHDVQARELRKYDQFVKWLFRAAGKRPQVLPPVSEIGG